MKAKVAKDEKIVTGGDDLGSIWYDFYGMSMSKAMDWIKRKGLDQYEVIIVKTWRQYWIFGEYTRIHVVLEKLGGPPRHISEFYDLLKWVKNHGRGHRIEFTTDNHAVMITLYDLDGNTKFQARVDPEEFKKYYNSNGHAMYFLNDLWDNLHSGKVHTA